MLATNNQHLNTSNLRRRTYLVDTCLFSKLLWYRSIFSLFKNLGFGEKITVEGESYLPQFTVRDRENAKFALIHTERKESDGLHRQQRSNTSKVWATPWPKAPFQVGDGPLYTTIFHCTLLTHPRTRKSQLQRGNMEFVWPWEKPRSGREKVGEGRKQK